MRRMSCLAMGFAAGFLVGSRAGRGPYERARGAARAMAGRIGRRGEEPIESSQGGVPAVDEAIPRPGDATQSPGVPSMMAGHSPMAPVGLWE